MVQKNQKTGSKLKKIFLLTLTTVVVTATAGVIVSKVLTSKVRSNQRYVQGRLEGNPVSLWIPYDTSFKVEPLMLLLRQVRGKDTVLRVANVSYSDQAFEDTTVISIKTIIDVTSE